METRKRKRLHFTEATESAEDESVSVKSESIEQAIHNEVERMKDSPFYGEKEWLNLFYRLHHLSEIPHGPLGNDENYVTQHNATKELSEILRTFLNSWLIMFIDTPLAPTQEESLQYSRTPEPNETSEHRTPTKSKLSKVNAIRMLNQKEDWLTFVQRHSNLNAWAEMCIQQFTVVQLLREAVGCLTPTYFKFNSNTIYKSESVTRTIQEKRSTLSVRHKANMTIELNIKQFAQLHPRDPFYVVTVEVQRDILTDVKQHKDYFKVCFALRNMLNDVMRTYSPKEGNLTAYGVLAGANGMAILAVTTWTSTVTGNGQKLLFFELRESKIFQYNDHSQVNQCIDMLRNFAAETIAQFNELEPTEEKFMDSAKTSHMSTGSFNKGVFRYEKVLFDTSAVTNYYDKLEEINTSLAFAKVHQLGMVEILGQKKTEEKNKLISLLMRSLWSDRSLGFIRANGQLYVFSRQGKREIDLIWRDDSGYHTQQGVLKKAASERMCELTDNKLDDDNDYNDSNDENDNNDHQQNKKNNSARHNNDKRAQSRGKSDGSTSSSSVSTRNSMMNYCSSMTEIVEEHGFTIDRKLMHNGKCFAFISHKSQCPVFVKLSIGTVDEEKVMSEVPKHTNLVQIFKHERAKKAPIEWKTKMEGDVESKKICYLTVTETLVPYDQYLRYRKIQQLCGKSKLEILFHIMFGVMRGIKELHKRNIIHGDLSIYNIMFRKTDIVVEDDFELHDAVIIDMNCSYSMTHSITGSIGSTRPFVCEEDVFVNEDMDCFSMGVLFAHYLKLILTGDEWFLHPIYGPIQSKKCHEMISKYMSESLEAFSSVFGAEYTPCFNHLKAIIEGCMITSHERMNMREAWGHLQNINHEIRRSIVQASTKENTIV